MCHLRGNTSYLRIESEYDVRSRTHTQKQGERRRRTRRTHTQRQGERRTRSFLERERMQNHRENVCRATQRENVRYVPSLATGSTLACAHTLGERKDMTRRTPPTLCHPLILSYSRSLLLSLSLTLALWVKDLTTGFETYTHPNSVSLSHTHEPLCPQGQ